MSNEQDRGHSDTRLPGQSADLGTTLPPDHCEPTPECPDNQCTTELNDIAVLEFVRDFGQVSRREIARVWPDASPSVAEEMTHRTVTRLLEANHLYELPGVSNTDALLLTLQGAIRIGLPNIEASRGYDLRPRVDMQDFEIAMATAYLVERRALGHTALSKHALFSGLGPIDANELSRQFGRVPAGLVLVPGRARGYEPNVFAADWIEILCRRASQAEYEQIFAIARSGSWLNAEKTIHLDRVLIITYKHREFMIAQALRHYLLRNSRL